MSMRRTSLSAAVLMPWIFPFLAAAAAVEEHPFRFFLHPDLVGGLDGDELKRRLPMYVADLNLIFSKQTIRRFVFDPETGISITTETPYTGSFGGTFPETGYEIWAHVALMEPPHTGTHGGLMSFDVSGAGVAGELHWDKVYDRTEVMSLPAGSRGVDQYWRQIHNMTHEIEHIFGAGWGEYFSFRKVHDTTGVEPIQNISGFGDPLDPFWAAHADWLTDPLAMWQPVLTLPEILKEVRFAEVTAAAVNLGARSSLEEWTLPDLTKSKILVFEAGSGLPVPGAHVMAWKVKTVRPYENEPLLDTTAGGEGFVEFDWKGGFNNYDCALLIKAYRPGGQDASVLWYSIFDAQEERLVRGRNDLEIRVPIGSAQPVVRFIRADPNLDGTVDTSDVIRTLGHLFLGEDAPSCMAAADSNGDGRVDIGDPIHTLFFLFGGLGPPPAPYPDCGLPEPGEDCRSFPACS